MRSWTLVLLVAAFGGQTTGEVTTREEKPNFQSSVTLVRVPVVVRDKQGHAVGTFHKEDFQLTDGGRPQYLSQFAIEGSAVPKRFAPPLEAPAEQVGVDAAKPNASKAVPTRFIAYVFDDVHLTMEELAPTRAALLKHLEQGIRPQDRVALLTLSGKVPIEFTSDLAKIRAALMKIMPAPMPAACQPTFIVQLADEWVNHDDKFALDLQKAIVRDCLYAGTDPDTGKVLPPSFRPALGQQDHAPARPSIVTGILHEAYTKGITETIDYLRNFQNVVRLLASMPGDRNLILVSPGMYIPNDLQKDLAESIDIAARSGVIIDTLDARGVYTVDPTGDSDRLHLKSPGLVQDVVHYDYLNSSIKSTALLDLAHGTGGAAVSQNDFLPEFNRLADPPECVYYLGFYPQDIKQDGKFHQIKVTVTNGKGLSVQARRGYWAPSREEDAAATSTREIGEAVFSRDEMRGLPIAIHSEFFKTAAGAANLTVTAHLDIRQIALHKEDDRNRGDMTLVCALFDGDGNYVQGTQKAIELRVKDENLDWRRAQGVNVATDFGVKSGAYMIRAVVRDAKGREMGAANGTVEIP
ncbi:MAG TPA: VWA domain-containing protein [Bryobacteraceae bacterium]|jgi:VWFA-related protein|nr:VWA domain-containing protein [Bryobacteraceae bacterium]